MSSIDVQSDVAEYERANNEAKSLELKIELAISQSDKLEEIVFLSKQNRQISILFSCLATSASAVFAFFSYRSLPDGLWLFVIPVALIAIFALAYGAEIHFEAQRISYRSGRLIGRLHEGIKDSQSALLSDL